MIGIVCAFFHTEGKGFYSKWLKKHKPKNPNSFTEQLQLRTQTRMMAEEIVIMDVVMQFH